jgi:hypothetical protein
VRGIRGARTVELVLYDLLDSLPQDDAGPAHLSLAEIITPRFEMVILDLPILEGELPSGMLVCEVMPVGMFVSSSVRTGVRYLVVKESVVAGHAAPTGSSGRAEMVGGLAVSGKVVEPRAVGAATALFILVLCEGIVLRVVTVPRNGTPCSSSQT